MKEMIFFPKGGTERDLQIGRITLGNIPVINNEIEDIKENTMLDEFGDIKEKVTFDNLYLPGEWTRGNLHSGQISLENLPPGLKENCGDTAKGNIKGQAEYTRCINVKYGNTATDQCVMGLGSLPGRWRANNGLNVINAENEDKKRGCCI